MNGRAISGGVLAVCTAAALWAPPVLSRQAEYAYPGVDLKGRLYRSVFQSGPATLSEADVASVPPPHRTRLAMYLERRAGFTSQLDVQPLDFAEVAAVARKRVLEGTIVSLLDTPPIAKLALDFVTAAPIASEWEGNPAGPLAEADYAERVLKDDPAGALAPFLYVFIAHRQRAAFEAQDRLRDEDAMRASAKKYRTFMQRARGAPDQIFALIADDLDRQAYVYLKTDKHPRAFNPDG